MTALLARTTVVCYFLGDSDSSCINLVSGQKWKLYKTYLVLISPVENVSFWVNSQCNRDCCAAVLPTQIITNTWKLLHYESLYADTSLQYSPLLLAITWINTHEQHLSRQDWIVHGFTSPPTYIGDGFYRSKDPTNSIKVVKEKSYKGKPRKHKENTKYTYAYSYKIVDN